MKVKYAWCDEIEEINDAIDSKGKADGFEGLSSANQIISISWDAIKGLYLVAWKVYDANDIYT